MLKKILALVLLTASLQAWSQTPATPASVERLLAASDAERVLDSAYGHFNQLAQGMAQRMGLKPAEQPALDRYMERVGQLLREEMSWQQIKEPIVQVYIRHFSEEEVQALLAFYESPAGRSMVEKMPAVMQDSTAITQPIMQRMLPRIQVLAQEFQADVLASRKAAAKAESSPKAD